MRLRTNGYRSRRSLGNDRESRLVLEECKKTNSTIHTVDIADMVSRGFGVG